MQDVDALFDRHLDHELREHEKKMEPEAVGNCCVCGCDLYEGEMAYDIELIGCYCEDCMDSYKIILQK